MKDENGNIVEELKSKKELDEWECGDSLDPVIFNDFYYEKIRDEYGDFYTEITKISKQEEIKWQKNKNNI